MVVVIGDPYRYYPWRLNLQSRFIGQLMNRFHKSRSIKSVSDENNIISLVGDINSKVQFLIIRDQRIKFVDSESNSDNLLLEQTMLVNGSKLANKYLIIDMYQAQSLLTRLSRGFIELSVKQPTLYSSQQVGEIIIDEVTIEYQKDQWKITTDQSDATTGGSYFPYKTAEEALGFIINLKRAITININCQDKTLDINYKPLNITVGRTVFGDSYIDYTLYYMRHSKTYQAKKVAKLLGSENIIVTIKAEGWGNKKPEFLNVVYSNEVTLDTEAIKNAGISVTEEKQKVPTFKAEGGNGNKGLSTEAIIGIVVAAVVVVGVVIGLLVYCLVCRKKKTDSDVENQAEDL